MEDKEVRRKEAKTAARERRRKHRKRVVLAEKIVLVLIGIVILAGGAAIVYNLLPGIQVERQLEAADEYVETQAYEEAIASCEEALKIDSKSVKAYRAMAGVYLTQEDRESAEQVLYKGWETTQDESLLQEYCVHLLNDAVADINAGNCNLDALDKTVLAIENNPLSEDGIKLLDACYERLFMTEETEIFCNTEDGFERYLTIMNRLIQVCEETQNETLKAEVVKLAVPENETVWLPVEHLKDYKDLLERVMTLESTEELEELVACIAKAKEAQDIFAEAFTIFDSGDFEAIKDFMQSETYIAIRDQFIDGTMEYWKGKTYIPVSREKLKLVREDGKPGFSFADFDECPDTAGVIKGWGAKQEDAGVQRLCISYEPASENGEYYPHKTYEFVYLYSNVTIDGEYVPQMNYRFETRIATPEGTTSTLIGDWGGEHEWNIEY